jgi:Ca-activated chloride channel family protein
VSFLWPSLLWLLLTVPLLVAAYVAALRRRKKAALRYASLDIVKDALGTGPALRRHVPPALFLIALVLLILAIARPAAVVSLPSDDKTIILAIDVSGSMRAEDVQPNRMAAAQAAARQFVSDQPSGTKIGLVSFAGAAALVQPPTRSREDVLAAIERFELQRATAIGSAILVSLKAIFPDAEFDLRSSNPRMGGSRGGSGGGYSLDRPREAAKPQAGPVPPGSYGSAAIILLTDGVTTTGPDPLEAAHMAAERGIRVFTVGVGTTQGEILRGDGWSMRVRLDEQTLKTISDLTRGEYFRAETATDLKKIYASLNSKLVLEKKETEITALFSAAAALFALAAGLLSLAWFNRVL